MLYLLSFLTIFILINDIFCGVLILSPKKTEISGLKPFDLPDYENLKDIFKKGKIISFKINSEQIPDECEHLLLNKYTSYLPNIQYLPENMIVLNKNDKQNCDEIKKKIRTLDLDHHKNILYLIFHNSAKVKRETDEDTTLSSVSTTTEESISTSTISLPKEKSSAREKVNVSPEDPVLYDAHGRALLYSSSAPLIRRTNESSEYLGAATIVTFDERDNYSRLSCTIPVDDGKVILRFRFPWDKGYWSLTLVELEDKNEKTNLTITQQVLAPSGFSHACGGETVFSDPNGTVTLTLYNMQVQPRTETSKFSDAYNCVPFMTGPICSGIFVTSILAIGLIIGLSALGNIKTMDKFDNSKTKQLTITVMGE